MGQIPHNRRAASLRSTSQYRPVKPGRPSSGPNLDVIYYGVLLTMIAIGVGIILWIGLTDWRPTVAVRPRMSGVAPGPAVTPTPPVKDTVGARGATEGPAPRGETDEPDASDPPEASPADGDDPSGEPDEGEVSVRPEPSLADREERPSPGPEPSSRRPARRRQRDPEPATNRWVGQRDDRCDPGPDTEDIPPDPEWEPYPYADEEAASTGWEIRQRVRITVREFPDWPDEPVTRRVIVRHRADHDPIEWEPLRVPEPPRDRFVRHRRSPCAEPLYVPPPPTVRYRFREIEDW